MTHLPDDQRCTFTTRDARRCRAARTTGESVCFFHLQRAAKQAHKNAAQERAMLQNYFQGTAAAELFPNGQLSALESAHGVNRFIAGIARLVAQGRLDPRIGCSLGYLAQIMLTTIPHIERERNAAAIEAPAPVHPLFGTDAPAQLHQLIKTIDDKIFIEPFPLKPDANSAPDSASAESAAPASSS